MLDWSREDAEADAEHAGSDGAPAQPAATARDRPDPEHRRDDADDERPRDRPRLDRRDREEGRERPEDDAGDPGAAARRAGGALTGIVDGSPPRRS